MMRMMKFAAGLATVLVLLAGTGCTGTVTGEEKTAQDYVEASGYYVLERLGEEERYLLEEGKLDGRKENLVIERMWSVQEEDPRSYLGTEISVFGFVVKNHLLQQTFRSPQKIKVFVILSDGEVIGGYSYPDSDEYKAFYSFEGTFSTRILMDHYVFEGESVTWTAEYVVDSKMIFTDRDGRVEYDGDGTERLSVTCKGDTEALGKVKKFEIAYSSRFGEGTSSMEFDEVQYLDKTHTLRLGGSGDLVGSTEETVTIKVTVDEIVEHMELSLVN